MMFSKIGALALLTLCFLVGRSVQEECVPQGVSNMALYNNHILAWSINANDPCNITEFHVYIFHPGQPAEYAYSVITRFTDVAFLEECEEWVFAVVPISGYYVGPERRLVEKLPVAAGSNLTIAYLNVNHNVDNGRTHLYWELADPNVGNCSLEYRVTVEESGSPVIEDFYVYDKSIDLRFLSSCTSYQFGIRAINVAHPTTEGPLSSAIHLLPGRTQYGPSLIQAEATATTIFMAFRLESEVRNPCPLRQLYIDGGSQLSQTIALSNEDRRSPVNVTITNLVPSTTYNLNIYVSNSVGWSTPTSISISTLASQLIDENLEDDE